MNDMPLTHVLIVDDDARLRNLLAEYLGNEGFTVTLAVSAADARRKLDFFIFDALVLDVMMPGETGTELVASLRKEGNQTPVLILTAMGESSERIAGLEAGADDYVVKPFEPRELVLRLRSILRRDRPVHDGAHTTLRFGEFVFRRDDGTLLHDGEPVHLTTAESTLLSLLALHVGETLNRAELAAALSSDTENERSVDVQITRLRKKIEPESARPRYIQTVRGAGYTLKVS